MDALAIHPWRTAPPPRSPPFGCDVPNKIFRTSPGHSPNRVSSTQKHNNNEDAPALEALTLKGTQLAPQEQDLAQPGDIPPSTYPQLRLTPHELSFVLQPLGTGDTRPAKQGVSPAITGGCSRYEGSAGTWYGW